MPEETSRGSHSARSSLCCLARNVESDSFEMMAKAVGRNVKGGQSFAVEKTWDKIERSLTVRHLGKKTIYGGKKCLWMNEKSRYTTQTVPNTFLRTEHI